MDRTHTCKKQPYGWIYLFLLPTILLYGMYTLYPLFATIWYSFLEWNGFQINGRFCGLEKYKELFSDPLFFNSVKVTFQFILITVPIRFFVSLLFAILLNWKRLKGRDAFRTMLFIPVVTTSAIIGTIMTMVFDPVNGPIKGFLQLLGIHVAVPLLGNADTALTTSGIIWCWKWLGTTLVYWLASLQSIPEELYEAATIDGAGTFKRFITITMPLLVPFSIIIFVLTLSDAMKVFDLMMTLTGGGPFFRTESIELFIYRWAFGASMPDIGYASAAATLFGLFFICITLFQKLVGRLRHEVE